MGRSGRTVILDTIPELRRTHALDFVVVNGENAAHGFGITRKIANSFYDAGVDVITMGNHTWDQREVMEFISDEPLLLRPHNLVEGTPGNGTGVFDLPDGRKVGVILIMGNLYMPECLNAFESLEAALGTLKLGQGLDALVVDIHAETTSEKMAIGHWCDGRASLVIGSHTHVPTADAQILPAGTAYQSDAGMCGDYDSVIGMVKEIATDRFLPREKRKLNERLQPARGEGTLCGVIVDVDDKTGLARTLAPLRLGGRLSPSSGS